jgi:tryptophan synthase alpha subunit
VDQAATVATYADGVIIGSALVQMLRPDEPLETGLQRVGSFLKEAEEAIGPAGKGRAGGAVAKN